MRNPECHVLPLALFLSALAGVSLGLLGGGGSILTTPILLYTLHMGAHEAIASSLLVVGVTSAAGVITHARAGNVAWKTGLGFGAAGMAGAWLGGRAAGYVAGDVLIVLFALVMVITAVAMLRGRREQPDLRVVPPHARLRIVVQGLGVGIVAGLVGAGGGFLVVPALNLLGGLRMTRAIGTSLLVIAMQCFAGFAGHVADVNVDIPLLAMVTAAAVAGSFFGGRLANKVHPANLRRGFGVFVLVIGALILIQQVREVAVDRPNDSAEPGAVLSTPPSRGYQVPPAPRSP